MKIRKNYLFFSLLLLVFALWPFGAGIEASNIEQNKTIEISQNQWNELKKLLAEQETDLMNLKEKLKNLKTNSTEQQQELERLSIELRAVRKSLMTARLSLTAAKHELEESQRSLEMLKQEIKRMENKQKVIRRQRDTWAALAAITVGAAILRG